MAEALRAAGCARVYATDIVDRGNGQDEALDFLSAQIPKLAHFDLLATNPPIVLTRRVVWFQRDDGVREAPKENSAWFLWQRNPLRLRRPPVILYAPNAVGDERAS
jgi:hypothetical protein